ncbi:MAG: mandelate racemase/muconate lactonizing enzyme family protein [Gammaproteobacteria bacterium]
MKIERCEISIVEIPLRKLAGQGVFERPTTRNMLVSLQDETGFVGWGEFCPTSDDSVETLKQAAEMLQKSILPALLGQRFESLYDVLSATTKIGTDLGRDQLGGFCAAELAALDLAGRQQGISAGEVIGPLRNGAVHYGGVIHADNADGAREQATILRKFGVADVKVTVGKDLEINLAILDTARQILGDKVQLRINANQAWDVDETLSQLAAMSLFKLAGVEQPVPGNDLAGMARITAAGIVPVIAEASLVTLGDARRLIKTDACDVFSIGISRCGGLVNASRMHALARSAGLGCQLGAGLRETGLLSAAGRQFATRSEGIIWCEGSCEDRRLDGSISAPDIAATTGGLATALNDPGLGVSIVEDRVAELATTRISIR